jgi:hypothetical protein
MSLSKHQLKESILIVIEPDGSHHVRIPEDDTLVFTRKAYNDMMNTMTVIEEPSFVLLTALYLERGMRTISNFFSKALGLD